MQLSNVRFSDKTCIQQVQRFGEKGCGPASMPRFSASPADMTKEQVLSDDYSTNNTDFGLTVAMAVKKISDLRQQAASGNEAKQAARYVTAKEVQSYLENNELVNFRPDLFSRGGLSQRLRTWVLGKKQAVPLSAINRAFKALHYHGHLSLRQDSLADFQSVLPGRKAASVGFNTAAKDGFGIRYDSPSS